MRHFLVVLIAIVGLIPSARGGEFGEFLSPLLFRGSEQEGVYELLAPFSYRDPKGKIWTVPPGIRVDGASIPRTFWSLIGSPFTGKYVEASIIHDHYCATKTESWRDTHRAFYDGMRAKGVDVVTANIMYGAVYRHGPRWLKTAMSDGAPAVIVGSPEPRLVNISEIKKLASRPGVTPEEIREYFDKALRVDARRATELVLGGWEGCSIAVEPLGAPEPSTILCDMDNSARGILAKRNLRILATDIKTLLSANSQILLPQIDRHIAAPTQVTWDAVKSASEEVLNVIVLTVISLQQYDRSTTTWWTDRGDSVANVFRLEGQRRAGLSYILGTRQSLLEDQRLSPPRSADEMRSWKVVFTDLLSRLDDELARIEWALR